MLARTHLTSLTLAGALVALLAASGCADPRFCDENTECQDAAYPYCWLNLHECRATPPGDVDAGVDGPRPDGPGDGPGGSDAGDAGGGHDAGDAGCTAPAHWCPGAGCVPNDVDHCGASCTECTAPANGTPTCDGTNCGFTCNATYYRNGTTCDPCDLPAHCGPACATCGGTTPDCSGHAGQCVCNTTSCTIATAPVCDTGTGACRACALHGECASGACDTQTGACVPATEIIYLDKNSSTCSDTAGTAGDPGTPFCTFPPALTKALAGPRYRIVARAGTYSFAGTQVVQDKTVMIIGARSTTTPTEFVQTQNNTPVFQLLQVGGSAALTLYGVTVRGGGSNGGHGIACSSTSTPALLDVQASVVGTNAGRGITATQCSVSLSQTIVTGNQGGGVSLTSGTHTIENCLITFNGNGASGIGGVRITLPGTPTTFVNNTVAINTASGVAGVRCDDPAPITNSIIWGNTGSAGEQQSCQATYCDIAGWTSGGTNNFASEPEFVDAANGNFHLKTSPVSPCIDAGTSSGAPAVDFEGKARVGNPDIGCYEAQ